MMAKYQRSSPGEKYIAEKMLPASNNNALQ